LKTLSIQMGIKLFEESRGRSVPEEHTSLCLQWMFQSDKERLQNKKVESRIKNLKTVLIRKLNATL